MPTLTIDIKKEISSVYLKSKKIAIHQIKVSLEEGKKIQTPEAFQLKIEQKKKSLKKLLTIFILLD